MELVQVLTVAFGGSVAAMALVAFLGKALISQFLAREMEGLKAQLQREARVEGRQFDRAQVMRRYQGPLMHAAYDLQSRLYNILADHFFDAYLAKGSATQRHYAQHNTAFLIAQFFGWMEIIRQEVQFIEFSDDDDTRRLSDLRDEIYRLWQTDRLADPLMIWAGEQRAIGELMIDPRGSPLVCMGYAKYLKSFGAGQEPLIDRLALAVLASANAPGARHDRLRAIQHKLIEMLDVLDPQGLRFRAEARTRV